MSSNLKSYTYSIGSFIAFVAVLYLVLKIDLILSVGFTVLVLIHELGHVFALKKLHKKIKGLYFLPFFGAIVVSKEQLETTDHYAFFKYLGPLFGALGVILVFSAYFIFKDTRLLDLAFAGAIFNGINMIPITFLDGYGVLKGISKKFEWLGILAVIIVGFFILKEYTLTLFLLLFPTLFGEDDATGYQLHEVILAIVFICGIVLSTIIQGKEDLISNLVYILVSIFLFGSYLKDVLPLSKKYENKNVVLVPLSKKQKYLWGIRWFLLTSVLVGIIISERFLNS